MSSISDELREFNDTYYLARKPYKKLKALADRIDVEMVELPRDKDGVPIRVGDTLFVNHGKKYLVTCIFSDKEDCDFAFYADCNKNVAYNPQAFSHENNDSLERIVDDMSAEIESLEVSRSDGDALDTLKDYLERIKALAEAEGGQR